jgi:hypothetical protein
MVVGVIAIACGSAEPYSQATRVADFVEVRDSAGSVIVEHLKGVRSMLPEWYISEEPVLQIGVLDGQDEYMFAGLLYAVGLSTGEVVVADGGSREIRYFDSNGLAVRSVGRAGRGPGEFSVISGLLRIRGDTLLVRDETGGRITWLDSSGGVVRVEGRPPPRSFHEGIMLLDGSRVVPMFGALQEPTERGIVWRPTADLAFVAHPAGDVQVLGVYRGPEQVIGSLAGVPLRRETLFATNGSIRSVAIGDTEAFDVALYDLTDSATVRLRMRIRRAEGPDPITQEDIETWRKSLRERYHDSPFRTDIERSLAEPVRQKFKPAFASVFLDTAGQLWVEELPNDLSGTRPVTIFSPQGFPIARANLPRGLDVLDIGANYILGRWSDQVGVSYVRRFSLIR